MKIVSEILGVPNLQNPVFIDIHSTSQFRLATFQVLNSYMRLPATILDNSSLCGRVCVSLTNTSRQLEHVYRMKFKEKFLLTKSYKSG